MNLKTPQQEHRLSCPIDVPYPKGGGLGRGIALQSIEKGQGRIKQQF
jgi:hypothetical protein